MRRPPKPTRPNPNVGCGTAPMKWWEWALFAAVIIPLVAMVVVEVVQRGA